MIILIIITLIRRFGQLPNYFWWHNFFSTGTKSKVLIKNNATFYYANIIKFDGVNSCNKPYTGYGFWAINTPKHKLTIEIYVI